MSQEVIFEDREISHGGIDHGRKRVVAVFSDDDVASPGNLLPECSALNLAHALVDREGHAVPGNGGKEYDVGIREFSVHPVQRLNKLHKTIQIVVRRWKSVRIYLILPGSWAKPVGNLSICQLGLLNYNYHVHNPYELRDEAFGMV